MSLLVDRPGLGTGLNQISTFRSNSMSAAALAVGGDYLGYSQIARIGVAMVLAGASWLFALERRTDAVTASTARH